MNNDTTPMKVDWINVGYIATSIGLIASYGWPLVFILAPIYYGQRALRNTPAIKEWSNQLVLPAQERIQKLLPAPKDQPPVVINNKNINRNKAVGNEVRIVDPYEHLSFWDRVTRPYDSSTTIAASPLVGNKRGAGNDEDRQLSTLYRALKRLPAYFHYTQLDEPPSALSVPIGLDADTQQVVWGDFDADSESSRILHAMIAGQTGSGKDALLRLWFTTLTTNNTPEQVQFIILDGKIDWLSDELANSAYMAIPPAGGIDIKKIDGRYVDKAKEKMADSIAWIFEEVERRSELLRKSGAVNLNAYNAKMRRTGGEQLPMLFLIASDVGKSFEGDLQLLVSLLIMKGRAFGIRMIISMQNPVGESTDWRAQIGLVMSGYQQNPDHDRYIMGVPKSRAIVRPSQLPNPEEDDSAKGLFVVRMGSKQYIVKTPHLPEEDWFTYIGSKRFVKRWYKKNEQDDILASLFNSSGITKRLEPVPVPTNPRNTLTHDQIKQIAKLAAGGYTKTAIMEQMGFTNPEVWTKKKDAVEQVIIATRGSLRR